MFCFICLLSFVGAQDDVHMIQAQLIDENILSTTNNTSWIGERNHSDTHTHNHTVGDNRDFDQTSSVQTSSGMPRLSDVPADEADDTVQIKKNEEATSLKRQTSEATTFQDILRSAPEQCDLCNDYRWLFVAATGRSGSTTTLNMLQAIPGVYLAGENKAVASIMDLYQKAPPGNTETSAAWSHGNRSEQNIICALQLYVKGLIGAVPDDTRVLGFKEIGFYGSKELDFFSQKLFPCAKFVVQTRKDAAAQSASHTAAQFGEKSAADIEKSSEALVNWHREHKSSSFMLYTEDFNVTTFNSLLEWTGVSGCKYTTVCHSNADGGYNDDKASVNIEGKCHVRPPLSQQNVSRTVSSVFHKS